ncbi:MAG: glycosyltransferase [Actinomycetota bacterium]|nr:glycosyltransferase [Actinomycetota bacterium]
MIVRDEADVVVGALDSVVEHLDTWVVVDTGSTDATMRVVADYFDAAGIAGLLVERPWVDFGHNRSEALELCRGRATYAWVHDADDRLVGSPDLDGLTEGGYALRLLLEDGDLETWRAQLLRLDLPWRYEGAVHEVAVCDPPVPVVALRGSYHVEARSAGARSRRPDRFHEDRRLLEQELARRPDDGRTVLYLAQSCRDAGDLAAAVHWYEHRARMGGWDEEVFVALLERARALDELGTAWPEVQAAFLDAWEHRPTRAEPLLDLARRLRVVGDHHQARVWAERAAALSRPPDTLFVVPSAYTWRPLDELAVIAFQTGDVDGGLALSERALADPDVPDRERARIEANRAAHGAPVGPAAMAGVAQDGSSEPRLAVEVCNLARRADRRRAFRRQAARALGEAAAERIRLREAVDGRSLIAPPELLEVFAGNRFDGRRAVMAHALTHLSAWGDAADRPGPGTVVLEDDVELAEHALSEADWCIDEADDLLPGWDLLFVGYHADPALEPDPLGVTERRVEPMRWDRFAGGTFAYVVSPGGAQRLIEAVYRAGIQEPLDRFIAAHADELVVGEIRPGLATSSRSSAEQPGDSDVAGDLQPVRTG